MASVALVADKIAADRLVITEQLQTALNGRVALEQAKGLLAQLGDLEMEESFVALRHYARDHNERLSDTALAVVSRQLPAQRVLDHARTRAVGG